MSIEITRGFAYHDTGSKPGEWTVAPIEGISADGHLAFALPKEYQQVHTRWSDGFVEPGKVPCQLCGTLISQVCWLINDSRKLTMHVGTTCVEKYAEALLPEDRARVLALVKLRVKLGEARDVDALVREGVDARLAVARVRGRRAGERAFDKKFGTPTDQQRAWWENRRMTASPYARGAVLCFGEAVREQRPREVALAHYRKAVGCDADYFPHTREAKSVDKALWTFLRVLNAAPIWTAALRAEATQRMIPIDTLLDWHQIVPAFAARERTLDESWASARALAGKKREESAIRRWVKANKT